jgi:hypothetical protein
VAHRGEEVGLRLVRALGRLTRSPLDLDVGVRAEPAQHAPLCIRERRDPREEAAEAPVGPAKGEGHLER